MDVGKLPNHVNIVLCVWLFSLVCVFSICFISHRLEFWLNSLQWHGPLENYIISPILGSNLRDVQSEISNSSRQWFLPIGKDTKASYLLIVNFSTWGCNSFNNTFVQPEAHPFNSAFCNIPTVIHIARSCLMLRACLDIVYFTETEKLLLKIKISWNSTVRPMNSTKMCNETYK